MTYEPNSRTAASSHAKSKATLPEHWSHEQEWLVPGSIDLSSLNAQDWLPLVPSESYADRLTGLGLRRFVVVRSPEAK